MGLFVSEMAREIEALYGASAAMQYRATAIRHFDDSIGHPLVLSLGVESDGEMAAVLFGMERQNVAQISCIHVLRPYAGRGLEKELLASAVQQYRVRGVQGILSEFLPLCPLDLDPTFSDLGFDTVTRRLMRVKLDTPKIAVGAAVRSRAIGADEFRKVAKIIVEAYAASDGRNIHAEVRDVTGAFEFVELAVLGGFGQSAPAYFRGIDVDGQLASVAIGCHVAPDTGFILQLVTLPQFRGKGLASVLLQDMANVFRDAGLDYLALGVTDSNPAVRIYTRAGFETIRPVSARYWWRV